MTGADMTLTRREALLRSAATVCLAGIGLLQALRLPFAEINGWPFAFVALAAIVLCVAVAWWLAAAPQAGGRPLWRMVAALALVVLAGAAARHLVAVPGLDDTVDRSGPFTAVACGVLALACLGLAALALAPGRAAVRGLATALAVLVAFAPGAMIAFAAIGPTPAGGAQAVVLGHVHAHIHDFGEAAIELRQGAGRRGSHFVVSVTPPPRRTPVGLALLIGPALLFAFGAVGHLMGRASPAAGALPRGAEGGLA